MARPCFAGSASTQSVGNTSSYCGTRHSAQEYPGHFYGTVCTCHISYIMECRQEPSCSGARLRVEVREGALAGVALSRTRSHTAFVDSPLFYTPGETIGELKVPQKQLQKCVQSTRSAGSLVSSRASMDERVLNTMLDRSYNRLG